MKSAETYGTVLPAIYLYNMIDGFLFVSMAFISQIMNMKIILMTNSLSNAYYGIMLVLNIIRIVLGC